MKMYVNGKSLLVVLFISLLFFGACGQLGLEDKTEVDIVASDVALQRDYSLLSISEYGVEFVVDGPAAELFFATDVGQADPASVTVVNGKVKLDSLYVDSIANRLIVTAVDTNGVELESFTVDLEASEKFAYSLGGSIDGIYIWEEDTGYFRFYSILYLLGLQPPEDFFDERLELVTKANNSQDTRVVLAGTVYEWLDYVNKKMGADPLGEEFVPAEEEVLLPGEDPPVLELEIVEVEAITDITVEFGTPFADVPLPTEVEVTLEDGSTVDVEVDWAEGDYDGDEPATYTLVGALTMPEDVINPAGLTAEVNVIVESLPTYTVTFDVTPADADVTFDGQAYVEPVEVVAGTYAYEVSKEGYLTETGEVVVVDEPVTVEVTLVLETYTVTFDVTPADADVTFDGQAYVEPVEVGVGTYDYTVEKEGYISEEGTVEVVNDDVTKVVVLEERVLTSLTEVETNIPLVPGVEVRVAFQGLDQEGQDIAIDAAVMEDANLAVRRNGSLRIDAVHYSYEVGNDYVEMIEEVAVGDKITLAFTGAVVATLEYEIVEKDVAVATTLELEYDDVPYFEGDTIEFTAVVRDQYGRVFAIPANGVYWVINGAGELGDIVRSETFPEEGTFTVSAQLEIDADIRDEVTVTIGDTPLYDVTFAEANELSNVLINLFADAEHTDQIGEELATDAEGKVVVEDLTDGTYYFTANRSGYQPLDAEFTVAGAEMTVDFEMLPVVDEYRVVFKESNALEGVVIDVFDDEEKESLVGTVTTDAQGEEEIQLPNGEYWFTATHVDHYYDYEDTFTIADRTKIIDFTMVRIEREVVEVADIDDIEVDFGTPFEALDLPEEVEVTLDNDDTMMATVDWTDAEAAYDPEEAGEQVLQGELGGFPVYVENTADHKAEVTVIVAPEVIEDEMWLRMTNYESYRVEDTIYYLANDDTGHRVFDLRYENKSPDIKELFFRYVLVDSDNEIVMQDETGRILLDAQLRVTVFAGVDWDALDVGKYNLRIFTKERAADSFERTFTFKNIYVKAVQLTDDEGEEFFKTYDTVGPALADAGDEYTARLFADIECSPTITYDGFILDLNGFTLDGSVIIDANDVEIKGSVITGDVTVTDGSSVTVDDTVTIEGDVNLETASSVYDGPDPDGKINREYLDPTVIEVANADQLYNALRDQNDYDEILLTANIVTGVDFDVNLRNKGLVLNLNGKTLKLDDGEKFTITGEDVEVKDGTIELQGNGEVEIRGDKASFDGVTVKTADKDFNVKSRTLTMKNSTVNLGNPGSFLVTPTIATVLNLNNSTFNFSHFGVDGLGRDGVNGDNVTFNVTDSKFDGDRFGANITATSVTFDITGSEFNLTDDFEIESHGTESVLNLGIHDTSFDVGGRFGVNNEGDRASVTMDISESDLIVQGFMGVANQLGVIETGTVNVSISDTELDLGVDIGVMAHNGSTELTNVTFLDMNDIWLYNNTTMDNLKFTRDVEEFNLFLNHVHDKTYTINGPINLVHSGNDMTINAINQGHQIRGGSGSVVGAGKVVLAQNLKIFNMTFDVLVDIKEEVHLIDVILGHVEVDSDFDVSGTVQLREDMILKGDVTIGGLREPFALATGIHDRGTLLGVGSNVMIDGKDQKLTLGKDLKVQDLILRDLDLTAQGAIFENVKMRNIKGKELTVTPSGLQFDSDLTIEDDLTITFDDDTYVYGNNFSVVSRNDEPVTLTAVGGGTIRDLTFGQDVNIDGVGFTFRDVKFEETLNHNNLNFTILNDVYTNHVGVADGLEVTINSTWHMQQNLPISVTGVTLNGTGTLDGNNNSIVQVGSTSKAISVTAVTLKDVNLDANEESDFTVTATGATFDNVSAVCEKKGVTIEVSGKGSKRNVVKGDIRGNAAQWMVVDANDTNNGAEVRFNGGNATHVNFVANTSPQALDLLIVENATFDRVAFNEDNGKINVTVLSGVTLHLNHVDGVDNYFDLNERADWNIHETGKVFLDGKDVTNELVLLN